MSVCVICKHQYDRLRACEACESTQVCFQCVAQAYCCLERGVFDKLGEDNSNHPDYCIDCGSAKRHLEQHLAVLLEAGIDCAAQIYLVRKKLRLLQ